jgi:RNA polymerase sigma-70 factor (ECF subfamily)
MTACDGTTTGAGAVAVLVENHRRFLAFLERRVGDRDTAEEILQGAFARGIERADKIRDEERVVAWFYRLLRRAVADHWRSRAAERRGLEALAQELEAEAGPSPEVANELCACFEPLLATLKPEHEKILRRVDLGEERPVDFAADAKITPNNAMVRLHRARRALRERMLLSCRACAEHGCLDCACHPPGEHEAARDRGDVRHRPSSRLRRRR